VYCISIKMVGYMAMPVPTQAIDVVDRGAPDPIF